jgi:hypothetical protein
MKIVTYTAVALLLSAGYALAGAGAPGLKSRPASSHLHPNTSRNF